MDDPAPCLLDGRDVPAAPFEILRLGDPRTPIIAHVPHASTVVPPRVRQESILLSEADLRRELVRLTDWHCDRLFSWVLELGGCLFVNGLSRLVFDPERLLDDKDEPMAAVGQGVVYTHTTDGARMATISEGEREKRIRELYEPYHEELTALVASTIERFGIAVLLDCHSFASIPLPSEPDQDPDRPDICIGTDPFHTPPELTTELLAAFRQERLTVRVDSPFAGTLVPLRFLGVEERVRSVMIEVRRGLYCDEATGERDADFDATRAALQRAVTAGLAAVLPAICRVRQGGSEVESVLSRAQGALLGQLAGDSLGSLVEFKSPEAIREMYPDGVRDLADGGTWRTLAGQPTDDSELALALTRTLVGTDAYSEEDVAAAYADWYRSEPFDLGDTTRTAFASAAAALSRGENPAAAAREAANPGSQANGALMRISPLGIFGWRFAPDAVARWARADASLSHPHPVCQDTSALFAVTIAHAVREGPAPEELYRFARSWAADADLRPEVRERLESAESEPPLDFMVQQGWVLTAFQNAFYRLLHAESFEEGVIQTVECGGDTDTNACIAGALLGACHGLDAIPVRWREKILSCRPESGRPGVERPRPVAYWPVDALELAAELVGESIL